MSRCIDADALIKTLETTSKFPIPIWLRAVIIDAPTIEPERTGRWIDHTEDGYVECPFCHSATNCDDNIDELHFCFSCGAKMEVEYDR